MLGFNQTITIYNKRFDSGTKKTFWHKTVIHGVSWTGCQEVTTGEGLTSNDGYSVRIPLSSMPEGFVRQDEYSVLNSPSSKWTAQNGDVVVLGEGEDVESGISEITKQYSESFIITVVHVDNLSRLLPHLRLEGK
ncbi:MAG: hypothetical protein GX222_08930 [Ruminococcaceae bacterium]|jgi:hypothetical protein|nr:hypothetical protein [Oscillospiraceae bacterium]